MSEVYHLDGTPTGPSRPFKGWDLEIHRAWSGWAWHTCNGHTLAAAGTAPTRMGARLAARLFALAARRHRPRTQTGRHMVITLKSGTQIRLLTDAYTVRANHLIGALTNLTVPTREIARVSLDYLDHETPLGGRP